MKQLLFLILLTALGVTGSFFRGPALGLVVYYLFAVLRPNYLWWWALPPGIAWSSYVGTAVIMSAVLLAGGAYRGGERTSLTAFVRLPHVALGVFAAWVLVTYLTAMNRDVSYPWMMEYVKIFVMFGVAAVALRSLRDIWHVYLAALIAIIYIAYEINANYLLSGFIPIARSGYGGLDNNGAGLMLAMGVPMALFAAEAVGARTRIVLLMAVPVLLHAVLMSYSRGAMVALIAAFPLYLLRTKKRKQSVLAAVALAALVPILAGQEIRARFFSVQQYQEDASAQSRFDSWTAALKIARDYPVFGVGIRNANLLSYQYGADQEGRTIHSQYLQLAADSGFPALGLYLLALGTCLLGLRQTRRAAGSRSAVERDRVTAMANGVEGALVVFCIGGAFLSLEVFELPYILLLLGAQLFGWSAHAAGGEPAPLEEAPSVVVPPEVTAWGAVR